MGSGCVDPHFLDLGTSWRWVVTFTSRPLYPRGKNPLYPLDTRLGGPQSRSGRRGEEKILDPAGTRIRPFGRPACSQSLDRLSYPGSFPLLIVDLYIHPSVTVRWKLGNFAISYYHGNEVSNINTLDQRELHDGHEWASSLSDSIGFWRWCITHRITGFSDFVHRPDSK
jgi:hypothetical protein